MQAVPHSNLTDQACLQCASPYQVLISLECGHIYCLICMSYIMIKGKVNGNMESQITCPSCRKLSRLADRSLYAIRTTIEERLLPHLNSIEYLSEMSSRNLDDSPRHDSRQTLNSLLAHKREVPKHNIHSFEQSIEHITPSTRYLQSKGDSPSDKQNKEYCSVHPFYYSNFVCITCYNELFCVKCMTSQQHAGHNVKSIEKGMQYLNDQLALRKLYINYKIDMLEIKHRRLQDRKDLLEDKHTKSKNHISEQIAQLVSKLRKKYQSLLEICNYHFKQLYTSINAELEAVNKRLFGLRKFKYDLKRLNNFEQERSTEFYSIYNKIHEDLENNLDNSPNKKPVLDPTFELDEASIMYVVKTINGLLVGTFKREHNRFAPISQFTSANNSAEKRRVKHLKTEDNEGLRLTTEHIKSTGKLETRCGSPCGTPMNQLPSYITKFLGKHGAQLKPMEGYSKCSKISLLDLSGDDPSKLMAKKRIYRKTTNPLETLKTQKLIFYNKRSKLQK